MKILHSRLLSLCLAALAALSAHAQKDVKSGVRPQVISLPTGPGSIEGLGESFEPQLNTGLGRYALPLAVPPGRAGFKPVIALQYEAGGGNGPLGIGWRLSFRSVQRQTDKGLPQYDASGSARPDTFITESGEELVCVEGTNGAPVQVFRLKNEGAFYRYTYLHAQDRWVCQEPSGRVTFLGARGDGLDVAARARHPILSSTYCWSIVESLDPNGNRIVYSYQANQAQIYCSRVEYGFTSSPTEPNRHTIEFLYGDRPDPIVDYRPAFRLVTALRLTNVTVRSASQLVRRYAIEYETNSALSLLSRVTLYGSNGVDHLPPAEFTWCRPHVVESSDLQLVTGLDQARLLMTGSSPDTDPGAAEILDFNGDGLPDLYESRHDFINPFLFDVFYQNTGAGTFERIELSSRRSLDLAIQSPNSFVQDINGDGLPDLIAQKGSNPEDFVFRLNRGGQWATNDVPLTFPGFETAATVFKDPDIRALDLDFDKRIDTLRTWRTVGLSGQGIVCAAFFNNGDGSFRPVSQTTEDFIRGLPTTFSESQGALVLADMNGDRLQDLVLLRDDSNGGLVYWPAKGYGRFDDSTGGYAMSGTPDFGGNPNQIHRLELQDLNRDGLADLYLVESGSIRIWLNRDGTAFDPPLEIVFGQSGSYDPADATYRVMDVDGDDFPDLLFYVAQRPTPDYLPAGFGYVRLFTGQGANVLKTISNGIGQLTSLAYRSSTVDLLRDRAAGRPWAGPFPVPVPVIAQVDVFDGRLSTYSRTMTYHDGCYDGQQKEFRGFGLAEQCDISNDASAPDLIMTYRYDTGMVEEALKGKPLMIEARDAQGGVFYRETNAWLTVKLADGATGETRSVTFAYQSSRLREVIERSNGIPVQLKWDYAYDSFGNLTNLVEWGRLDAGWGDERITRASYTGQHLSGQTNWILEKLVEQTVTDSNGVTVAGKRNYYDNLPLGAVAKGNLTRSEQWIANNDWTPSVRNDYDAFGNIIFIYDPLYDRGQPEKGHFREIVYDPDWHTFPVQEIIHTGNTNPATLTMFAAYDPGFGVATSSADFNGFISSYGYDTFGRLTSMTKPPDTFHTVDYEYVLGHQFTNGTTVNWVETRKREEDGSGTLDSRLFYDGLGRTIMTRAEGEFPGQVVVTDTVLFNGRKLPWKKYLPYFETNTTLAFIEPVFNTGYTEHFYDALGREIRVHQPVGPDGIAFSTTSHAPLTRTVRDEEQTRTDSIHFGCGMRYVEDGLVNKDGKGRLREVYEIVKLSDAGEALTSPVEWKTAYRYDLLDNLTGYTDSQNNQKFVYYDGLGRKTFMDDPDRSWMWYAYDAASNLIRTRDAKGQEIAYAYDGVNRLLAEYYTAEAEHLGDSLARAQRWAVVQDALPARLPDVAYHYDLPYDPLTRYQYWQAGPTSSVAMAILDSGGYDRNADLNGDGRVDATDLVKAARGVGQADSVTAMNTLGYLSWVQDQSGEEHNSYDERGRVKWTLKRIIDVEVPNGVASPVKTTWGASSRGVSGAPMRSFFTSMTYDSQDRVTRLVYPDGTYVFYNYNSRGLLESVPNVIERYDYNSAGQNKLLQLACGVTSTYDYDHRLRLKRIHSIRQRDGLTLQDLNYDFDGVSNITGINDGRSNNDLDTIGTELGITSAQARKFSATQSFLYDSLYRLTQASNPSVFGTIAWRYDRIGNLILQDATLLDPDPMLDLGAIRNGGIPGSWTRIGRVPSGDPGPHAVSGTTRGPSGPTTLTYDPCGNMLSSPDTLLNWDQKDRLFNFSVGVTNYEQRYDYSDEVKIKTLTTTASSNKASIVCVDALSQVQDEVLVKRYYAASFEVARTQRGTNESQDTLFALPDHLGSTELNLSQLGNVLGHCSYYPNGWPRDRKLQLPDQLARPLMYAGHEHDRGATLYDLGSRFLAVLYGAFCSTDHLVLGSGKAGLVYPQSLNAYRYAANSSLSRTDPSGRSDVSTWGNWGAFGFIVGKYVGMPYSKGWIDQAGNWRGERTKGDKGDRGLDCTSFVEAVLRERFNTARLGLGGKYWGRDAGDVFRSFGGIQIRSSVDARVSELTDGLDKGRIYGLDWKHSLSLEGKHASFLVWNATDGKWQIVHSSSSKSRGGVRIDDAPRSGVFDVYDLDINTRDSIFKFEMRDLNLQHKHPQLGPGKSDLKSPPMT